MTVFYTNKALLYEKNLKVIFGQKSDWLCVAFSCDGLALLSKLMWQPSARDTIHSLFKWRKSVLSPTKLFPRHKLTSCCSFRSFYTVVCLFNVYPGKLRYIFLDCVVIMRIAAVADPNISQGEVAMRNTAV